MLYFFVFLPTVIIIGFIVYYAINIYKYNKTSYRAITNNSYFDVMNDKGKLGEYEIYRSLKDYEKEGCRFLFNVYLPKTNGKTVELDVLMISPVGVFVFESKNYSGWIFGNDNQKNWTQVLPTGIGESHKDHFYNPVWQNRTHCCILKQYLPQDIVIHSVVLFSDRCTFKNVTVNANDVVVAHHCEVQEIVNSVVELNLLSKNEIEQIYDKLYPFSQVLEEVKQHHLEDASLFNINKTQK